MTEHIYGDLATGLIYPTLMTRQPLTCADCGRPLLMDGRPFSIHPDGHAHHAWDCQADPGEPCGEPCPLATQDGPLTCMLPAGHPGDTHVSARGLAWS